MLNFAQSASSGLVPVSKHCTGVSGGERLMVREDVAEGGKDVAEVLKDGW